jgi:hydroxyethylthiazole kinase-like uncharacterized protein yjeF
VRPVLDVSETRAAEAPAIAALGHEALIERAGRALARHAISALGGAYGRRAIVVAGRGHNGDDGRVAARALARAGVVVSVADGDAGSPLPPADLVVDALFGVGFHGDVRFPPVAGSPLVVACDLPSGVVADTGEAAEGACRADLTVTMGWLKPGLVLDPGASLAGRVVVEPVGLVPSGATTWLVDDADVADRLPVRARSAHKWRWAVGVVAGSPGMWGAAKLAAKGAIAGGAGMVRLGSPSGAPPSGPVEAVGWPLEPDRWVDEVTGGARRLGALVVGPGLGRVPGGPGELVRLVRSSPVPLVLDADALGALGEAGIDGPIGASAPVVLTPHDGELARLTGSPPGPDRRGSARRLAASSGAVVLLKGPQTIVAHPDGRTLLVNSGSARLASAGTGDVLSGLIGAFIARGLDPWWAAALGAHVHGAAAGSVEGEQVRSGLLPEAISRWLEVH